MSETIKLPFWEEPATPAQIARHLERQLRAIIPVFTQTFNNIPDSDLRALVNNIAPGLIAYAMQLGVTAELMENNLLTPKPQ